MITRFKSLFSINIQHGYYSDAGAEDFYFLWPAESLQLMRNGRVLPRASNGMLYCLYEADADGIARKSIAGNVLTLGLKLRNPYFTNFTQLELRPGSCQLYRNTAAFDAFDVPLTTTPTSRLTNHSPVLSQRPVKVDLLDTDNQTLFSETITDSHQNTFMLPTGLRLPSGSYHFREETTDDLAISHYLLQPELHSASILACCEIQITDDFYQSPPTLTINFNPRNEVLKYYVVAQNYSDSELAQLTVADNGFIEEGRPQITFSRVETPTFDTDDIQPDILGAPQKRVVMFRSQSPVSRQLAARRKIQLSRNGEVLVANLPAPGADKSQADFIIHVAKP